GETTVRVVGGGRGGRNQELALAAAPAIKGRQAVLLSCGTDGIDGNTEAAGAIVDGDTMTRARALGLDPGDFLRENNCYVFMRAGSPSSSSVASISRDPRSTRPVGTSRKPFVARPSRNAERK